MKSKCMMIAVCSAAIWLGMPEPSFGEPETYVVIVTAYTCEAHPSNPMYPCGPLRWGGDIHGPGMACPVAWRDRVMVVPGYGTLRCDDTPREGFLYGLPHLDLRVSTVAEARRIGVRRMSVRSAAALQPNPTHRPAVWRPRRRPSNSPTGGRRVAISVRRLLAGCTPLAPASISPGSLGRWTYRPNTLSGWWRSGCRPARSQKAPWHSLRPQPRSRLDSSRSTRAWGRWSPRPSFPRMSSRPWAGSPRILSKIVGNEALLLAGEAGPEMDGPLSLTGLPLWG